MLVDVARQLFAKKGIANTTMNDIAVASGKGRRTLYTYFNRKEEIFSAVIESELERLSEKLDEVDLVADITHYCIKGLEVPFIYGRLGHGLNVETSKPQVAKVVYGALGKSREFMDKR